MIAELRFDNIRHLVVLERLGRIGVLLHHCAIGEAVAVGVRLLAGVLAVVFHVLKEFFLALFVILNGLELLGELLGLCLLLGLGRVGDILLGGLTVLALDLLGGLEENVGAGHEAVFVDVALEDLVTDLLAVFAVERSEDVGKGEVDLVDGLERIEREALIVECCGERSVGVVLILIIFADGADIVLKGLELLIGGQAVHGLALAHDDAGLSGVIQRLVNAPLGVCFGLIVDAHAVPIDAAAGGGLVVFREGGGRGLEVVHELVKADIRAVYGHDRVAFF